MGELDALGQVLAHDPVEVLVAATFPRRVRADVEPLARLVLAASPTARTPVGLVVDAVGQAGARAWDTLVLRLEGVDGVKLLGSVRNEELLPLRTLRRAVLVPVSLDEEVARQIHQGLLQRGATTLPHWKDAYDKASGLTLEFTHLLTRGQRLSDVIADQVRARTHDNRWTELAIIAVVALRTNGVPSWTCVLFSGSWEPTTGTSVKPWPGSPTNTSSTGRARS